MLGFVEGPRDVEAEFAQPRRADRDQQGWHGVSPGREIRDAPLHQFGTRKVGAHEASIDPVAGARPGAFVWRLYSREWAAAVGPAGSRLTLLVAGGLLTLVGVVGLVRALVL